jgi:glycosyltransferase involved in cell wall biosynthesis
MPPKLSLILPVHNQGDHIAGVVRDFAANLKRLGVGHEIILVPNASVDDSSSVCLELARELAPVRCLEIDGRGWGRAVRSGIAEARGELICYTNAARTKADDLGHIVEAAIGNPGVIIKARRVTRHGVLRWAGSLGFNLLCRLLFDLRTADVNGTPKLFPRSATTLLHLCSDDDLLDLEFMWRCRRDNLPVMEIEIHAGERHGGRSTTNWKTAVGIYGGAIRFWRRTRTESLRR